MKTVMFVFGAHSGLSRCTRWLNNENMFCLLNIHYLGTEYDKIMSEVYTFL